LAIFFGKNNFRRHCWSKFARGLSLFSSLRVNKIVERAVEARTRNRTIFLPKRRSACSQMDVTFWRREELNKTSTEEYRPFGGISERRKHKTRVFKISVFLISYVFIINSIIVIFCIKFDIFVMFEFR
jgi:hypothetical protein